MSRSTAVFLDLGGVVLTNALQITQRQQNECLFIDDRAINIEAAERLGMRVLRYRNPQQLEERLRIERLL